MRGWLALAVIVGGCGFPKLQAINDSNDDGSTIDAAPDGRTEVARIPVTPNLDVDMLFVVDDSPSMLDKQTNLKNAFPGFVNELTTLDGGLPNIHIGVVTTDVGSKGADDATAGPMIGNGPGSCSGTGKAGNLQTNAATVNGPFISDIKNPSDGTRITNYTGSLSNAFSAIASVGAAGCGFEQHFEAIRLALNGANPANAGFLRKDAGLAIIVLTDEDDCSMSHSTLLGGDTATLGPLQSFRCSRFGITCQIGGTTTDEMNIIGSKMACRSNETSPYLTDVGRYANFLQGLKVDPTNIVFAALSAPTTPFDVELRAPPGGGTAIPALAHSCMYAGASGPEVGDPAVRLQDLASRFVRNTTPTVCAPNLSTQLVDIARHVRGLVGDNCLTKEIAQPADCVVADHDGSTSKVIPKCGPSSPTNCYQLVADAKCSTASQLRLDITRSAAPSTTTFTTVACKL